MTIDMAPDGVAAVDWDWSKVVPGEVIEVPPPDGDDDIAPGIIEVVPDRLPIVYRGGSAAMTVAAKTGRAVGLSTRWFSVGTKHVCILAWRYVRGLDHADSLGGMSGSAWNAVRQTRRERWKLIGWTAAAAAVLNAAGWAALVKYGDMSVLEASATLPGTETVATGAAVTLYGRYRVNNPGIPVGQILADEDMDDGEEPFPLAWCKDGAQVEECVGRAFDAEGLGSRRMELKASHFWGRELDIDLKGCTPGEVSKALERLDTHFDIRQGGTMPESDPQRASHITLRLVESDPFATMPRPQVHAPRSLSVHHAVGQGRAMDGTPFELTFDGFCALVVGAMGAGKTLGALRTIAEALTACEDAVCWDLDPLKGGLAEFGDLMEVRARGPEECEEALERALRFVTARSVLMPRLGMGDRWKASAKHPHLYLFLDEFLQLSPRGKKVAVDVLRTGRQYGIYVIFAGQEATEDALGDAIAGVVPYRIGMACRFEDVKLLFGQGKGALGWRPDRMEPAVGEVLNDAGQSFIMGGPLVRPIRYRFNGYTREQIEQAVPERVAAGVNRMDADTLLEAGEGLTSTAQAASLADKVEALAAQGGVEDADLIAVLLRAFESRGGRPFLPTQEVLLPAIRDAGFAEVDATKLSAKIRKHAPMVKGGREDCPEGKYLRGWHRTSVERAVAGLLDPAQARQNPGMTPA